MTIVPVNYRLETASLFLTCAQPMWGGVPEHVEKNNEALGMI